jgi:hypothetical protein
MIFHLAMAAFATVLVVSAAVAGAPDYEQPPISYSTTQPHDSAAKLMDSLERGDVTLTHDSERGYLDAILRELKIPTSSQTLVFSKTSFQRNHISPRRPRALYFNDDTYVGYVPGGDVIEIASVDPKLGTNFYTIQQSPNAGTNAAKTRLTRQTDNCLQCHGESMTRGVPGLLVRSVFADDSGQPILSAGTFLTTHESPLSERWGGWYVTGSTGPRQPHMGNTRWQEKEGQMPQPLAAPSAPSAPHASPTTNPSTLPPHVDADEYLTPHSDVVALMVLEHQAEAHNRITRAVHGTLRALRDEQIMSDALGEPTKANGIHSDSTLSRIESSCEPLVEYLLFANEAPLTDRVAGSSTFAADFSAHGPRDSRGRSLRDFDLKTRLFRYPCSYLIYSPALQELPDAAKQFLYRRLWDILSGKETGKPYAHLTSADRAAIMEILRDTKPDLRTASEALDQRKS